MSGPCEGAICLTSLNTVSGYCLFVHSSTKAALPGADEGSSQAVLAECVAEASDNWLDECRCAVSHAEAGLAATHTHTHCCAPVCPLLNGQCCQPVQHTRQACKASSKTDLRCSQLPAGTLQDLVGALLCQGPQSHTGLGHLLPLHSSPEPVNSSPTLTNCSEACSLLASKGPIAQQDPALLLIQTSGMK